MKNLVAGDEYGWPGLGFSFDTRSPVRDELFDRAPRTLALVIGAAIVGHRRSVDRRALGDQTRDHLRSPRDGVALFGVSAPVFWLGLIALYVFWQKLGWLPGTGYVPFSEDPGSWFSHLICRGSCLLFFAAFYARITRGSLLETMGDYIRTARAKGLSERRVIFKHGLRASLTPIVTMLGMDIALLIGGAVIESVFNIQGLGNMALTATFQDDLPSVLGVVVVAAAAVAIMNLIVDIVYAWLDPRVRYQ